MIKKKKSNKLKDLYNCLLTISFLKEKWNPLDGMAVVCISFQKWRLNKKRDDIMLQMIIFVVFFLLLVFHLHLFASDTSHKWVGGSSRGREGCRLYVKGEIITGSNSHKCRGEKLKKSWELKSRRMTESKKKTEKHSLLKTFVKFQKT